MTHELSTGTKIGTRCAGYFYHDVVSGITMIIAFFIRKPGRLSLSQTREL